MILTKLVFQLKKKVVNIVRFTVVKFSVGSNTIVHHSKNELLISSGFRVNKNTIKMAKLIENVYLI